MSSSTPLFTLIAVTSRDGRITGPAGEPPVEWASAEEQALFTRAVAALDWSFIGRRTHTLAWRADRRRVVFSTSARGPLWRHPRRLWVDPERVPLETMLAAIGKVHPATNCGILGGVRVHDWFAERRLIDAARITIEPVTFAGGLPLFSAAPGEDPRRSLERLGLSLVETRRLNPAGTLLCRFARAAQP